MAGKYANFYQKNQNLVKSSGINKSGVGRVLNQASDVNQNSPALLSDELLEKLAPRVAKVEKSNDKVLNALILLFIIISTSLFLTVVRRIDGGTAFVGASDTDGARNLSMPKSVETRVDVSADLERALGTDAKGKDTQFSAAAHYAIAKSKLKRASDLKDFSDAKHHLSSAILNGEKLAGYELGYLHENELISDFSIKSAIDYYRLAAAGGSANAAYRLGVIYGREGEEFSSRSMAAEFFTLAEQLGHADASARLKKLTELIP